MKSFFRASPLLLAILVSCNSAPKESVANEYFDVSDSINLQSEAREIIYSLYLPTDISQLFEKSGTNFNPQLLISLDNIARYEDLEQMALIIGALGVDLSYCKIFQQSVSTVEYYEAIELLSEKLEIPASIFESSSEKLDLYFKNQDSLSIIINTIYSEVNDHFKSTDHDALASISLFGGWIEALYIGVNIYENENHFEMGNRLLQQKFALNNMITLLSNYQESLVVRGYVLLLNKLRSFYKNVEIQYEKEGFKIDTTNKKFQTAGVDIFYEEETLDEICLLVRQIHKELLK